jgi:polyisoprenoid-binding protein YceI
MRGAGLIVTLVLLGCGLAAGQTTQASSGVPVFTIEQERSAINFSVKASVAIEGKFDKWDASLTCPSTDPTTCVLDVKIDAASVDTGSGMKNNKLKGKDFFDAKQDPYITFHSNKVIVSSVTSPSGATLDVTGTFTIRGVSKPETLKFTTNDIGKGEGKIEGTMAFDRREYGMNSGIPFIKIADRVEVTVNLDSKRVSGPPMVAKQ